MLFGHLGPGAQATLLPPAPTHRERGKSSGLKRDMHVVLPSESRGPTPPLVSPHTHTPCAQGTELDDLSTPPSLILALPQGACHIVKEAGDVS